MLFYLPDASYATLYQIRQLYASLDNLYKRRTWSDKHVSQTYTAMKELSMSRKKGKQQNETQSERYKDAKEVVWCNIKTTDEDLIAFDESELTPDGLSVDILQLISEGFTVSVKRRDGGETYQFTAICQDTLSPNYGHGFSAFGDNPFDTIAFGMFKYYKIASRDLCAYAPTNTGKRRLY